MLPSVAALVVLGDKDGCLCVTVVSFPATGCPSFPPRSQFRSLPPALRAQGCSRSNLVFSFYSLKD